jgi:hypothetical protein
MSMSKRDHGSIRKGGNNGTNGKISVCSVISALSYGSVISLRH